MSFSPEERSLIDAIKEAEARRKNPALVHDGKATWVAVCSVSVRVGGQMIHMVRGDSLTTKGTIEVIDQ